MRYELTADEWIVISSMVPQTTAFWVLRSRRLGATCRTVLVRTPPATIALRSLAIVATAEITLTVIHVAE
jgi:hypothetical protein